MNINIIKQNNISFAGSAITLNAGVFPNQRVQSLKDDRHTKYQKAKPYIIEGFTNNILDKNGQKVSCAYLTVPSSGNDYKRIAVVEGKVVGMAEMRFANYACGKTKIGFNDFSSLDMHQIVYLATSPDYKGVGKDLIKAAIMDSVESGKDGQILLKVMPEGLLDSFKKLCGDKIKKSPVPFYYNLGFRFIRNDYNRRVNLALKNMQQPGAEYPKDAPREGFMYLKESDAWKMLDS